MSRARYGLAAGVVNGVLYAVGGPGSTGQLVEAYDPSTNTWTTKAPMPTARHGLAAGVVNGVLYAVGGANFSSGIAVQTVEAYDPSTNTWTTKAPMSTARYGLAAGVVNGVLYAVGGTSDCAPSITCIGITVQTVEAYDPSTNTWTPKAPMPTDRYALAAGVVNGVLYAVGGNSSISANLGTNEAFTPPNVPFDAFAPKVEIELGPLANDDEFEVKATLTLGTSSDGIAPLTEAVTIQVGSFSATIPSGSFKLKPAKPATPRNPAKPEQLTFEGIIDGVALEAKITPRDALTIAGAKTFEFKAEGNGVNLTGTVNPVTVGLTIGNDQGSATVTAEFE
jgi:hypothetical protein